MSIHARFRMRYPDFSLDTDVIMPGKGVTALFGHSGSGKTTCLRAIAGLEHAPDAYLEVNGEIWQDSAKGIFVPTHRRPLGYVFQDAVLFPHLSVRDNLNYGQRRIGRAARRVGEEAAIELLGIGALLERKPDRLSGGEKSRVAIARALLTSPRLLLMDEPLAALDLPRKQEILPYLERLNDELDIPMLYVSHAPDEVARLADHLVVLQRGEVVANGPLGETLARLDLPIALGEDAGVVIEATVAEHDHAWHLARVEFPGGSLWIGESELPHSQRVRVRVLARDVSIATHRVEDSSIQNTLAARVVELADDTHPAHALLRLDVGGVPLLARLTRRAAATLRLEPGKAVWAQVKAVALIG